MLFTALDPLCKQRSKQLFLGRAGALVVERARYWPRQRVIVMSAEVQKAADAAHWGRLMEAVANQRAGFARLLDNSAPRVKTLMRRSSYRREDPDAKDPEPGDTPAEAIAAPGGIAS